MRIVYNIFRQPGFGLLLLAFLLPTRYQAQEADSSSFLEVSYDTVLIAGQSYRNQIGGEFSSGRGFDVFKSKWASLNISLYGLARYVNQMSADSDTFTDHLGRPRVTDLRNDIHWHRTFVWLTGFFYTPRLRYNVSIWGLTTTDQVLLFGNLQYFAHKAVRIGVGIGPNLGSRSMQGSWPYWYAADRQMADDFFRPGFTNGFWITGEPLPRVGYTLMLGNALSNLGVTASALTRDLSQSASVWWMPTTGEFGPRGGFSDFEIHDKVATRFGASYTFMNDDRLNQPTNPSPVNTQVRMSDAVLLYETGALADGVTIQRSKYQLMCIDAAMKYKGFGLATEFYIRRLSDFQTDGGPVPYDELNDQGFYVQTSYQVIKKRLEVYGVYGTVMDEFERNPWEVSGGLNYFPAGVRNWRLNLHVIRIEKSPHSSYFGYYTAGQTGTTISIGTDFLL